MKSHLMDRLTRRRLVLEFIENNSFCTKEKVVNGLKDQISRRTIYDILHDLIEQRIVQDARDIMKENSRDHKLSVVKNNIFYSTPKHLENFESSYYDLLDKALNMIQRKDVEAWKPFKKKYRRLPKDNDLQDLLFNTLVIFQMMIMSCMYNSIIEWPKSISDKGHLLKLQSEVFQRIAEFHSKLYGRLRSSNIKNLEETVRRAWKDLYTKDFLDHFADPFEDFGLFEDLKKVGSTGLINHESEDVELDEGLKKSMASGLKITK